MSENNEKKVLIVGKCSVAYSLAEKMAKTCDKIFVAPGSKAMESFATVVDIREKNVNELLEFALENGIDLTIVISDAAIKQDIYTLFSQNEQLIFAPSKNAAYMALNKSNGRKFMYKNRIPCPRFAIFDKMQNVNEYLKTAAYPIVIKAEEHQNNGVLICNNLNLSQNFADELFSTGEKRLLIEDYIFGHEFSFYVITDGYQALELGCAATYKYELEGNGGLLSAGMGAFVENYKISNDIKSKIMNSIVFPTLEALQQSGSPYIGILGIDLVIDKNEDLYVIEYNTFLNAPEAQCILPLIDQNLYELFEACAVGSFADDFEKLEISDSSAAACVIKTQKENNVINGIDKIDDNTSISYFDAYKNECSQIVAPYKGRAFILTRTARVLSRAVNELYEDLNLLEADAIKFRNDIGKIIET